MVPEPVHIFQTPGVGSDAYIVALTATNPAGRDITACSSAIHVFPATALDSFVRENHDGFKPGLDDAMVSVGAGYTQHSIPMQSQVWHSQNAPLSAEPVFYDLEIFVPDGNLASVALLVLGTEAEDDAQLGAFAVDNGLVVAALRPESLPSASLDIAVKGVVRAMDTLQQVIRSVSCFAVAGAGTNDVAVTAWLSAAVDQRVCAVFLKGKNGVDIGTQSVPGIGALRDYALRVQIPVIDMEKEDNIQIPTMAEAMALGKLEACFSE